MLGEEAEKGFRLAPRSPRAWLLLLSSGRLCSNSGSVSRTSLPTPGQLPAPGFPRAMCFHPPVGGIGLSEAQLRAEPLTYRTEDTHHHPATYRVRDTGLGGSGTTWNPSQPALPEHSALSLVVLAEFSPEPPPYITGAGAPAGCAVSVVGYGCPCGSPATTQD